MPSKQRKRESISIRRDVYFRLRTYVQKNPQLYMGPLIEGLITKMLDDLEAPHMSEEQAEKLAALPKVSLNNPESRGIPRKTENIKKHGPARRRKQMDMFDFNQKIDF